MKQDQIIKPLMYIDQPSLQSPKAFMQAQYQSQQQTNKQSAKNSLENKKDKSDVSFKDLTIPDKISYLLQVPKEVPDLRCEVVTEEDKYRGVIIDEKEEEIILRIMGRGNESIKKKDITKLQLLGF